VTRVGPPPPPAVYRVVMIGRALPGQALGGLTTGAEGKLGIGGADELAVKHASDPGSISGLQRDLENVERRTDDATTAHSVEDTPAEGA
jgi:hypothetical protein